MDTNQKMVKAGMMKMVKTASRNVYTIAVCHNYERYMSPDGRLGSKIQAVKLVRQVTGVGLKEAKDFVEGTRALRLTFSQIDHLTDSSFVIAESTDPFASTEMPCYLTTPTLAQPEKTSLVRIAVVINGKRAFAYADNKTATMTDDEHEKYAKAAAIQANRWEGAPLPFMSMDVAMLEDGTWKIVECGDGGVSGLPQDIEPFRFYAALWNKVHTNER